ncbi:DUF421 domain-containing protein [Mesobacillus harenae]|uniref:DUF421 domain-containing protein n=1 Tax=Mesobacillus harenae TaxID=2213203 RepID=UPI0015805D7D|nr:DUF421 domain-containing protein [Mesobacillus harenae]
MTELAHVLVRGLVGFFLMLILARIMGKKQITQITYYEYIVGISIGSIAAELTFSPHIRMSNFILGMIIWSVIPLILAKAELKSPKFRTLLEGKPTTLVSDGKILENNMRKVNLTIDEMMILLRQQSVFKLSDVQSATMEKNGQVTVLKKRELQPLTPKDIGMNVKKETQPRIVVIDGNLMEKSLIDYGFTKEWLLSEINKQGAKGFSDVFMAQIDSMGNVYADLYNDNLKMPQMKEKLLVAANVKQLQKSLISFSLKTENAEAKKVYREHAKQMDKLMDEIAVYLKD